MKNKLFTSNKVPQALIVRQAPLSNFDAFLKDLMKSVVCDKHGCGECVWCQKIDQNKYFDLKIFDSKQMKKQDVVDLINRYSRPGLESCNFQFYVIKNIEYASKSILNSLLKFVEEPPKGVYAIFTTRNYDAIIPTIKSRCFTIYLQRDEHNVDDFLNSQNLNVTIKTLIKKCFYDLSTMQENFDKFIEYLELIQKLASKDGLNFAIEGLNLFRKMEYTDINLFIEICKNAYPSIASKIIVIQDNLYLNSPKSLIYNQVYNLLSEVRK